MIFFKHLIKESTKTIKSINLYLNCADKTFINCAENFIKDVIKRIRISVHLSEEDEGKKSN